MVSHQARDGGDFLSPQRSNNSTQTRAEMAKQAMLNYKKTGCLLTRDALLLYYMDTFVSRLAAKVASSVLNRVESDDLKQSAFFALNSYIDKFDPSLNYKFESFARLRIEGAMLDFLRKEDPASRRARTRSKQIAKCINSFQTQYGRRPTDDELRQLLHLDETEFVNVMRDAHVPCTLSYHPCETDNDEETSCAIHVEAKYNSFNSIDREDLHAWLFQQLDHYSLLIVTLTYTENLTMLEIGNVLGYSESRVSQKLKYAHGVIKARLLDHPEELLLMAG